MFFSQLTLLSNTLVLTSYLSGIYLESWFSWLWGGLQKISKKRRKQTEEEKENRRMRGKSNNNNIHLSFKLHFVRKHNLKKICFYHQILFTVFMRCRVFETQ